VLSVTLCVSRAHGVCSHARDPNPLWSSSLTNKSIYKPEHVVEIYKKEIREIYKTREI
jgi:hypothetical protein